MSINTQPISDAHDKIFEAVIAGLGKTRTALVSRVREMSASRVPLVQRLAGSDAAVDSGFDLVHNALTKQHDFVEGLLAKAR